MVSEGVAPESLIDVDNKVITTAAMITDDDILRSVTANQQEQSDEDDNNDEEVEDASSTSSSFLSTERPLRFQVESAIDVTRNAALYSSNGEEMSLVINKFEKLITVYRIAS